LAAFNIFPEQAIQKAILTSIGRSGLHGS